jgi:hypothetical protein
MVVSTIRTEKRGGSSMKIRTIGIDLAKEVFGLHAETFTARFCCTLGFRANACSAG